MKKSLLTLIILTLCCSFLKLDASAASTEYRCGVSIGGSDLMIRRNDDGSISEAYSKPIIYGSTYVTWESDCINSFSIYDSKTGQIIYSKDNSNVSKSELNQDNTLISGSKLLVFPKSGLYQVDVIEKSKHPAYNYEHNQYEYINEWHFVINVDTPTGNLLCRSSEKEKQCSKHAICISSTIIIDSEAPIKSITVDGIEEQIPKFTYNGDTDHDVFITAGDRGYNYILTLNSEKYAYGSHTIVITDANDFSEEIKSDFGINTKVKRPKKISSLKVKLSKSELITISYNKQKNCNYQIQLATDKKFKKIVRKYKTTNTNYRLGYIRNIRRRLEKSKTNKKYKIHKIYYIRVRAYKNINDTRSYGKWSSVKKIRVKK